MDRSLDPAVSPPQSQWGQPQTSQCHSPIPIFNYIEKLRIDESNSLDDDLEDINNYIVSEVGEENLVPQNEFDNNQLMVQFQQDMAAADMANKIKVCF